MNNAALYGDWDMGDQSFEYLQAGVRREPARRVAHDPRGRAAHGRAGVRTHREPGVGGGVQLPGAARHRPSSRGLGAFNYQQTKWGVVGLTKFSAAQLGRWNITVNCIAPGVIATEATLSVVPEPILETLAEQQAVPGVLHADDLTGTAVFFASEESRFITGQVLVVDGGKYMPA